jgi:mRNA-degrading endonuclease toxin of MazEF toxin-antitoxin module
VRQGGIYEHAVGTSRYRMVVVSSDAHNATGKTPWLVPVRHGAIDAPPYLVALADTDPLGGTLDIDHMTRALPNGDEIGILTGATMTRLREAIYTLFAA